MKKKKRKPVEPTGLAEIDRLEALTPCRIADYLAGVSAYVRNQSRLEDGPKKASQIRLSSALARCFAEDLSEHLPHIRSQLATSETKIAGGLRTANADVCEAHPLDGLRLAVELKPINLAVGRAIWNRFGDIRTFAVNVHLKFPFAVVGGVLVIPTYEEKNSKLALEAEASEVAHEEEVDLTEVEIPGHTAVSRKPTTHLIERAIERLVRAGGRKSEADAPHLLEAISVVVFDPDTGDLHPDLPSSTTGLRWGQFIENVAIAYKARFEI